MSCFEQYMYHIFGRYNISSLVLVLLVVVLFLFSDDLQHHIQIETNFLASKSLWSLVCSEL
jgi:hypothetical protein